MINPLSSTETIKIDSHVDQREKGLVEAVLRSEHHLDPATGQVILIMKRGLCNPNLPDNSIQEQEISRRVLSPTEITEEIREKIGSLTEGEKSSS
jgi:hypothetical protein